MSKPLESAVERDACEYAKQHGWMVFKFVSPGCRGVPDRLFIRGGRHLFVEFKREGEVARRQQEKRHRELREHGAEVHVIDNLRDAYELLH